MIRCADSRWTGGTNMTYQLKDQDVTPPDRNAINPRSAAADGIAALVIVVIALGLIVLVLSQTIH